MAIERPVYSYKTALLDAATLIGLPIIFLFLFLISIASRLQQRHTDRSRLMWGPAPIINNPYWARAMREAGYHSESYTENFAATLNGRSDYDRLVTDDIPAWIPLKIRAFLAFSISILRYDYFFFSFEGGFLGPTKLWWLEAFLIRVANKKVAVLCFGGDVFIYNRVRSMSRLYGLVAYAPKGSIKQREITKKVDYWVENANCILPGFAFADGLGRLDMLAYCVLCIDTNAWAPSKRASHANGVDSTVRIAHAPNSRGGKGSRYIIKAVETLKQEGLKVELVLIEGAQNAQVKTILSTDVDILAEQLILIGYGLNGMEGMASGLPVIANLEDEDYFSPLRRWSYFDECPVVSATPENITDTLRTLVLNPSLRHLLGAAGRNFVEKYHSNEATVFLFEAIIKYMNGSRDSMLDFCDPEIGEFPKRLPLISHPLIRGKIQIPSQIADSLATSRESVAF